jgi:hypothetical protein
MVVFDVVMKSEALLVTYLIYLNCCYCIGTQLHIQMKQCRLLLCKLSHAKHNLTLTVGGSWSLARLPIVNQTASLFRHVRSGTETKQGGCSP